MRRPPICVKCKREMRVTKNEFLVKDKAVGNRPSTVWMGDVWECPSCGAEIVAGFGVGRIGESLEAMEFTR